jgi:hypothetical protein
LEVLSHLPEKQWTAFVHDKCVLLRRAGGGALYSPLTAVFWELTGEELHRGSFLHPEITERFSLPWHEILEITYAEIACVCKGRHYSNKLRVALLEAVAPLVRADRIAAYCLDLNCEREMAAEKK